MFGARAIRLTRVSAGISVRYPFTKVDTERPKLSGCDRGPLFKGIEMRPSSYQRSPFFSI